MENLFSMSYIISAVRYCTPVFDFWKNLFLEPHNSNKSVLWDNYYMKKLLLIQAKILRNNL